MKYFTYPRAKAREISFPLGGLGSGRDHFAARGPASEAGDPSALTNPHLQKIGSKSGKRTSLWG